MQRKSIIPKPLSEYDLRLLRIFVAVVEHNGFSAAANTLGITRSTISVHMSNLETRMQLKLCLRGRAGFSLTEDGQIVYRAVMELFESFDGFSLLVNTLGQELSGELVILCADQLDGTKQQKLAEVIQKVHDLSPHLNLVLDGDSISDIERALLKDKAHIGLFPSYQQIEGLQYKEVFSEKIYLCCSNLHPFFNKTDNELSEHDLATANAVHPGIDIDLEGKSQLSKLNLSAKSYQFDTRKAMILSGRYIGYLPQSSIQQDLNLGLMRIIKPSECFYPFTLSMVTKKTARDSRKVEMITDIFNQVFNL
ncbi:LysR family transcriptional regulator [Psychrosphaera aquimarina]|uniref:LysR family transcriptional regulator n=1 Tax=Psychrosphaera aquimarina TaxID=2044854 RepID=A0ABU3QZS1_9GAMM|nr:LysR family transcriptional regulator [Psychrosphaera aquimarina]MDU0112538.1 LysR family transcriptional regulator [Psychrosphaera aquimarina]